MKIPHLFIALALFTCGCKENRAEEKSTNAVTDSAKDNSGSGYWEKLTMQPFLDDQGMVMVELPFPSTWQIVRNHGQGQPSIIDPNGIQVYDFPGQSFFYTNDPSLRQTYQRVGKTLRVMPGNRRTVPRRPRSVVSQPRPALYPPLRSSGTNENRPVV